MSFEQRLFTLAEKIASQKDVIQTEEATKNAFVMPFISSILGYDVFDPLEVVPEFTADVGIKKGEKVDYAILKDSEVQTLIECKPSMAELRIEHASQLFRYFSVTNARIAILTNGQVYNFYTDLDAPNKMDDRPFLVLDLLEVDTTLLPELQKLTKETFDLDSIINAAEELKYVGAIKRLIADEFSAPQDDFVRLFASQVYSRRLTVEVRDTFTKLVEKACSQFLNERVNDRLKKALGSDYSPTSPSERGETPHGEHESVTSGPAVEDHIAIDSDVFTTEEELEGYQIVKAIACSELKPIRIAGRDAKSYFAILIDDNNRKPIARLWFNGKSKKYLGLFDENKNETRHEIETLEDLYEHAEAIRASARRYA